MTLVIHFSHIFDLAPVTLSIAPVLNTGIAKRAAPPASSQCERSPMRSMTFAVYLLCCFYFGCSVGILRLFPADCIRFYLRPLSICRDFIRREPCLRLFCRIISGSSMSIVRHAMPRVSSIEIGLYPIIFIKNSPKFAYSKYFLYLCTKFRHRKRAAPRSEPTRSLRILDNAWYK